METGILAALLGSMWGQEKYTDMKNHSTVNNVGLFLFLCEVISFFSYVHFPYAGEITLCVH